MAINHVCRADVKESPRDKYKTDTKAQIDEMVLSYLVHQGYIGTVNAMKKNIEYVGNKRQETPANSNDQLDQETRNTIRKLLMAGHVDMAIEKTEAMYPHLLDSHPDLLFQLKSRKYLDILMDDHPESSSACMQSLCLSDLNSSDTDDDTMSIHSGRSRTLSMSSTNDLHHQVLYEEHPVTFGHYSAPLVSPPLPVAASGRRLSWAAIAASPSAADATHLEDAHQNNSTKRIRRLSSLSNHGRRNSHSLFLNDEEDTMTTVRKAMHYGQQLQEEYQHTKYWNQLMEMFGLLSYSDPKSSPMGYLLDPSRRDLVASDLNNAIQGK